MAIKFDITIQLSGDTDDIAQLLAEALGGSIAEQVAVPDQPAPSTAPATAHAEPASSSDPDPWPEETLFKTPPAEKPKRGPLFFHPNGLKVHQNMWLVIRREGWVEFTSRKAQEYYAKTGGPASSATSGLSKLVQMGYLKHVGEKHDGNFRVLKTGAKDTFRGASPALDAVPLYKSERDAAEASRQAHKAAEGK